MIDKALFEQGLANRKDVLGAEYVEANIASADDFNMPLQEMVTAFAWGHVWGRTDEFPRRMRSIINLAMLTALNRPHELKTHIKGALTNGVTREEIREVFLQAAIYCGFPAAIDSFRIAREAFNEVDGE